MTETEQAILDKLFELESAVANVNKDAKPDLLGIFSELDKMTLSLPRETAPDLMHYMHKRSYEKARLFFAGKGP